MPDEIISMEEMGLVASSSKKYYGYVFNISKKKLDDFRKANNIKHDDFIEFLINFTDDNRIIKISYDELMERLD